MMPKRLIIVTDIRVSLTFKNLMETRDIYAYSHLVEGRDFNHAGGGI